MPTIPHDVTDLYLAPVVLAVEERIEELGGLPLKELALRVAMDTDTGDWTVGMRTDGMVRAIGYLIDLRGWELSWHPRGIAVTHDNHRVVLGIPPTFARYVDGETG